MTFPRPELSTLVHALVRRNYRDIDPRLPALIQSLTAHGAQECWHKHGTFFDHLFGVFRMLRLWKQPDVVCHAGLFHSAYSNEFVDLAIFSPETDRGVLSALVGAETEEVIYEFCAMPRRLFIEELRARDELPDRLMVSDRGRRFVFDRAAVRRFVVLTMADLAEQWFGWQDEVWSGHFAFPSAADADKSPMLWPGLFVPTSGILHVLSYLARHLRGGETPLPPVFNHCAVTLSREDETRARDAYVQAQRDGPSSPATAMSLLTDAIHCNPFVAEPRLVRAQLALTLGNFDSARRDASAGLDLLIAWGTPYDKRILWEAWLAWARLLAEHAGARRWPTNRASHNNLGLVASRR